METIIIALSTGLMIGTLIGFAGEAFADAMVWMLDMIWRR